mgnify:CR=1 FL=1
MKGFFMRVRERLGASREDYDLPHGADEGYVEISSENEVSGIGKITVRPFILNEFNGIKPILDCLREGYSIIMVNIKPLKDADIIELKRAISKIKKTAEAINGDIAGLGEDWICICPSFAKIHRDSRATQPPANPHQDYSSMEMY